MSYPQGINFRDSSGYVTDVSPETYEITGNAGDNYPRVTAQGNTVGWQGGGFSSNRETRNRNSGNDRRLAGFAFNDGGPQWYRFDLPAAGSYLIRAAMGDPNYATTVGVAVYDNTTLLSTLIAGSTSAANSFKDATNVQRTAAAWPGSNASVTLTFASTVAVFRLATSGRLCHLYIEAVASSGFQSAWARSCNIYGGAP